MLTLPDLTPQKVTCPVTRKQINRDESHRFGVGFSHYTTNDAGETIRSYAQVFNTLHCADRPSALKAIKGRIDNHHTIPFGSYDPEIHNPGGHTDDKTCKINLEYNQEGCLARAHLPKECAICQADLTGKDIYVPHVDDSTNGHQYQDYIQEMNPGATLEQCTLGACSMEHAQQLAHAILDEIIEPYHAAKQAAAAERAAAQEVEPA